VLFSAGLSYFPVCAFRHKQIADLQTDFVQGVDVVHATKCGGKATIAFSLCGEK